LQNDPARFERARVNLARFLFINAPMRRLAVAICPNDHPWRGFLESSWPSVAETTTATLQPRTPSKVSKQTRPMRIALISTIAYLILADIVGFIPGIGATVRITGHELQPLTRAGVIDKPSRTDLLDYLGL
jgi:hypothetical protein